MTIRFLVAEGLASVKRVAAAAVIGSFLTGIALAIVGGFSLVALAYRNELSVARAQTGGEVLLHENVDSSRVKSIADELTSFPGVRTTRIRWREEATHSFSKGSRSVLPTPGILLPLTTTIHVEMDDDAHTVEAMTQLGSQIRRIPDVEDVVFPSELVRMVDDRSLTFVRIALLLGVALCLSVIGIVAMTAQLTIVSRRSVIRTMHLLGAERRWVIAPFVIEGLIIGLVGGALATGILYASKLLFPQLDAMLSASRITYFPFLFPAAGGLLGMLGAGLSSRYYAMRAESM